MKVLAFDPNPASLDLLEQHCRAILATRLERFARATVQDVARLELDITAFDVVLLDAAAGLTDGLGLLAGYAGHTARTILVAADAALAARAFEHGLLDFVPKPVQRERLAKALQRAAVTTGAPTGDRLIAVRRHGRIDFVAVDDLLYVEGADKYSELVLANGQRSFYDQCLGRLEATLPRSFVRIHKSYLVRFPQIARLLVLRGSRYFAVLKNGQRLPVGRSRYAQIKSRLI